MNYTSRMASELLTMILDHLQDVDVLCAAQLNRHWRAVATEHGNFACPIILRRSIFTKRADGSGFMKPTDGRRGIELLDIALQCNLRIDLKVNNFEVYPHVNLAPPDWVEVRAAIGRVSHRVKNLSLEIDGVDRLAEVFESMHAGPWPLLRDLKLLACKDDGGQVAMPIQFFQCNFPQLRNIRVTDLYFPEELVSLNVDIRDSLWPSMRHFRSNFCARAYGLNFSFQFLSGVSELSLDLASLSNFTPKLILPPNLRRLFVSFQSDAGYRAHVPSDSIREILDIVFISHKAISHLKFKFQAAQPVDPTKFVASLPETPAPHVQIFTKHVDLEASIYKPAMLTTACISVSTFTRRFEILHRAERRMPDVVRRLCKLRAMDRVGRLEIDHEFLPYVLRRDIQFTVLERFVICVPEGGLKSFWPVTMDVEDVREVSNEDSDEEGTPPSPVQPPVQPLSQQKRSMCCPSLKIIHLLSKQPQVAVSPRSPTEIRWDEVLKLSQELAIDLMPREERPQLLLEGITIVQEQPFSQVRRLA